jgi:carbamoyl-phosphate synthase/aspartate carbamoyltransferase/dihydroorotase
MQAEKSKLAELTERPAKLLLKDGTEYEGFNFGAPVAISGECVFQTGMVGYVESLTDPSYRGQILVLSYPLIGNYGVPVQITSATEGLGAESDSLPVFMESDRIQVAGLVICDYSGDESFSHWNAHQSLGSWLNSQGVPGICGVDTRALIKHIRDTGSMPAKILPQSKDLQITQNDGKGTNKSSPVISQGESIDFVDPNQANLVALVSTSKVLTFNPTSEQLNGRPLKTILMVDCGMKSNQVRCLLKRGVRVRVVPWNHPIINEPRDSYDGLFLSNGPGNPALLSVTVQGIKDVMTRESTQSKPKPIFGICLGNQLLGLAAGGSTYKLKFGNRGQNQPCIDLISGRCHLTMQNHGFAIDTTTLPSDWKPYFENANDATNEGIIHSKNPWFSVQFHPEAKGGPTETEYLFDKFIAHVREEPFYHPLDVAFNPAPVKPAVSKVILLGSGGLSIGQAGEFDYSGSQAIKALKEEGVKTILINPNIATVQTSAGLADKVYFLPVTPAYVIKIIEEERPDGILLQFGGQTALNCGIELYRSGALEKFGVKVLGTSVETIIATEDREVFAAKLREIDEKIAPSIAARSVEQAMAAAEKIGFPVIIRAGFALGGLGSGFASNSEELLKLSKSAFASCEQILVEKSLKGWKEIEYEVVRDSFDNCITVCNMENFDPLGIHTGESIVVAPSQTLSDTDYHLLRKVALSVVRHLKVIGECNIQFAFDPHSEVYFIIEVNARLSRSSALASKATGYPLAFIAAKLAMGHNLQQLRNSVTKSTTACWEPSLDYVVVKMPRWDLKKFSRVSKTISTSMKSVGEVMAIGRVFEEAIQKAIRMVHPSRANGFHAGVLLEVEEMNKTNPAALRPWIEEQLVNVSDERIFVLAEAFEAGYTVEEIQNLTKIDRWFLAKLHRIHQHESMIKSFAEAEVTKDVLHAAKKIGFSDKQIARAANTTESAIRSLRLQYHIIPHVKQIDTVAAEFPLTGDINYTYMTYNGIEDDCEAGFSGVEGEKSIIVLGSGSYSIGSSVEFDWCAVSCIRTAASLGYKTIMINYNPETVSTDYDECDRLYFEELSVERVLDIVERENPEGVVVSMGGQIPNNIAMALSRAHVKILGTSADMIETAENRYKFSRMLDMIGVDQPMWKECRSIDETKQFCDKVGFPCLVRPSFVLSGAGMNVVHTHWELESFLETAQSLNRESPVVITKFISNAKEIDVDSIASNGLIIASAISEHVENAGVHSGDATLLLPAQDLAPTTIAKIQAAVKLIGESLNVSGPFNVQFIAKDDEIKVIECNLRASRSLPFVSKTLLVDFAQLATKAILGLPLTPIEIDLTKIPHVGTKVPQFSFTRLQGADPVLGVEMASTGEVACFGKTKWEAYAKALLATGFKWPKNKKVLLSIGTFAEKAEFLPYAKRLIEKGYQLFGTPGTSDFVSEHGLPIETLQWGAETDRDDNSVPMALSSSKIDLCIMLPSSNRYRRPSSFLSNGYQTRRLAIDFSVPLVTNIKCAKLLIEAMCNWESPDTVEGIQLSNLDVRSNTGSIVTLPGLFDVHVHLREPGGEYKEDWESGTASALAGGFTFVGAMPNTNPSIVDPQAFHKVAELAKSKARCDYGIFMGASVYNAQEIGAFAKPNPTSPVFALKMYLDQTFSTLKLDSLGSWMEHFANWPKEIPICLHSEGPRAAACILLAHLYDRHVHVCHVSLKEEIELIKQAKQKGIKVTCEVCPHHLFLCDEDAPKISQMFDSSSSQGAEGEAKPLNGGFHEVRPRLNTRADQEALWANMDVIDIIATDHAPHTVEEKSRQEGAPPGFPGLETVLPLMLTAVAQGRLSLNELIAKMHTNPRRIFNLPEQPDTWIEVDLETKWTIPTQMTYTKSQWTPFAGMQVQGKVRRVVLRGEVAMVEGRVIAKPGTGKNLALERKFAGSASSSSAAAHTDALPHTLPSVLVTRSTVAVPQQVSMVSSYPNISSVHANRSIISPTATASKRPFPLLTTSPTSASSSSANLFQPSTSPTSIIPNTATSSTSNILLPSHYHGPIGAFQPGTNVIGTKQFSRTDLHRIFAVASDMKALLKRTGSVDLLKGKIMANVFYEPSTRTSSSFYTAMTRLGGSVLPFEQSNSSVTKGESLEDTVKTLSTYADILVLRHPEMGAVQRAATVSGVPIINAGDGVGEHPTQALLDVFTIREELGTVNGLNVTIVGDLKHGRTVHSLVQLLSLYNNINFTYISPNALRMPEEIISIVAKKNSTITQREIIELDIETLKATDVLYVTRIQKERFTSEDDYHAVAGSYKITPHTLTHCKDTVIVMHPMPRVDEIDVSLDSDPRAAYFRQTENGLYIRMALLAMILGKAE